MDNAFEIYYRKNMMFAAKFHIYDFNALDFSLHWIQLIVHWQLDSLF